MCDTHLLYIYTEIKDLNKWQIAKIESYCIELIF